MARIPRSFDPVRPCIQALLRTFAGPSPGRHFTSQYSLTQPPSLNVLVQLRGPIVEFRYLLLPPPRSA
jgi:hypothetical protein